MKYTKKLNDPTPEQLKEQCVPLRQKYEASPGQWRDTPYEPAVTELVEFMEKHGIPSFAKVEYWECGTHTIALSW